MDDAIAVMRDGAGTQFDPDIVDALLDDLEEALAIRGAERQPSSVYLRCRAQRVAQSLSADCPRRTRRRVRAADDRRGKVDRALLGNPVRGARELDELVGPVDVLLR